MNSKESIIMTSDASAFPPWTAAQRDAQIEAQRFAYLELVFALHRQGVLDMNKIEIHRDEPPFHKNPETSQVVDWYADTLAYMRLKSGEPGQEA